MNGSSDHDVEVFTEALQLPVGQRAAYLDRACRGDAKLRQRVEALLRGHDEVGDFLEHSPHRTTAQGKPGSPIGQKPGDRIGRFKLLQQIGEGGCGVVFMAEQEEPVRRRVALKIIKPGMDTKSVIARFEAERQVLALMDHPNIAKIFEAGATESGRPYFVMELVRGIKITEFCDQRSLTTEARLQLFVQVCQAIQHAHQKGIIHRDIKPSNILVTTTPEGTALPVVIDFGIAKATTNQRLTDKTLFTAFEMLIGTPAYMSPEQAELTSVDVDTRTDIYSLGVLLYELLTGSTPFDTGELLKTGLDEIRRVIREQEPVRPSTRLSKLMDADLTTVAQCRHSEPPTLIRAVRGDLDWIAMKALEKDRTRRYETANGMALDVERYLANEPISARPPSRLYKLQKTFLRNKFLVTGVGLIALLLVLSLVVVSASLANERQARREAEAASVKSEQVTKFLESMISGVGPSVALGQDTAMLRGILDRTAKGVSNGITNQPAVEAELRDLIGSVYSEIEDYKKAEAMDRAALAIHQKLFGKESKEAAASLNGLGQVFMGEKKPREGEEVVGEALAIRQRLFGNENADTATSLNDLSALYVLDDRIGEAEPMAREALAIRQKLFGNENLEVADSLRNLSIILGDKKEWAESEAMAREVLAIRRKLLGPENPAVADSLNDVAWAAGAQNKLEEAETLEREALAMRQRLLGADNPAVANSLFLVGNRTRQRGNLSEADSVLTAALSIQRKVLGADNPDLYYTLNSLGLALEGEGKWPEAEAAYREALASTRKRNGNEDGQTIYMLGRLGTALGAQGKWPEAEALDREAVASSRRRVGDEDGQTIGALDKLGVALDAQGKWPEAEAVRREALASWARQFGDGDPETLYKMRRLASTLDAEGKWPEAETIWRESLTMWRKRGGVEDSESMYTMRRLGLTLEAEHKWPEAESLYREALSISRKKGEQDPEALMDLQKLVRVLMNEKKFTDAQDLLDKVLTPSFVSQSSGVNFLTGAVNSMGRYGWWQEAAAEAALLLQAQPADHYNYHRLAALLVITQNRPAYEQLCQRAVATFTNTTNPYVDERMAQDCLLLPHSGVDLQLVDRLADASITFGGGTDSMPFFQACKAMSNYRLGHFPEAIEWGEKATNNSPVDAQAKAYAILAMAHWQLGQKDVAQVMLAKGDDLAPSIPPGHDTEDLGESWMAWLMARISLDEATVLIQSGATTNSNSNQP